MNTSLIDRIYRIFATQQTPSRPAKTMVPVAPAPQLEGLALDIAACEDLNTELPLLLAPLQRQVDLDPAACHLYLALSNAGGMQLFHAPHICPPAGLAGSAAYQLGDPHDEADMLRFRRPGGGSPLHALRLLTAPGCNAWLLLDFAGPLPESDRIAQRFGPLERALRRGLALWHRQQQWRQHALSGERRAFAAELHDSVAQVLGYLNLRTSKLQTLASAHESAEIQALADDLALHTRLAFRHTRELIGSARLGLDGAQLHEVLESTVQEFEQGSPMVFELDDRSQPLDLTDTAAVQLVFIVREALCNAVRHAHASHIRVQLLRPESGTLTLRVEDNGRGLGALPKRADSFGLGIMRERAERLGAAFHIGDRPGGGTRVEITLVLKKEAS